MFYDFTCSAPKSVSVLAVTLDDQRLVEAHEAARQHCVSRTGNFRRHARAQTGQSSVTARRAISWPPPSCMTVRAHWTRSCIRISRCSTPRLMKEERCWKALEARGMYDAIRYGTAVYRNELAKRVQQIGYRIDPAKHGFEIEGVSPEVLKRFSKRAQQRDAVVKEWNKSWGENFPMMPLRLRCIRAGRKRSKAFQRRKSASGSWRNCQRDERQSLEILRVSARPSRCRESPWWKTKPWTMPLPMSSSVNRWCRNMNC